MGEVAHPHASDHGAPIQASHRGHVLLLVVVAVVCVAAVAGVVLQWPASAPDDAATVTEQGVTLVDGRITAIEEAEPSAEAQMLAPGARELSVTAELSDGRGVTFPMVDETGETFAVGQRVRIAE